MAIKNTNQISQEGDVYDDHKLDALKSQGPYSKLIAQGSIHIKNTIILWHDQYFGKRRILESFNYDQNYKIQLAKANKLASRELNYFVSSI